MNTEVKTRMIEDFKGNVDWEQLLVDMKLCQTMAEVVTSTEILALSTRLLQYIEELESLESFYENLAKMTKSKYKSLLEYHRLARDRAKQLAIIEHEGRK